ncbi:MAG TPA: ribosomal protein S18-alanine N-acetyltransferase [Actinomycetota bacterium]|nr:ribosomal protein S18-alanine N-acetyltransferase [Actinomycetota bacterium]
MSALARDPGVGQPVPEIEITRMRRRHLRRVLAIEAQVYPRPWSASLFLSELAQRNTRIYIVARHEGEVIGYSGMMFTGREAHITNIAVDPALHSRKVGTRLLLHQVTEAIARGAQVLSLEVRVSNHVAQSMYENFGFAAVSIRKGYYIETNEDAIVMVVDDLLSNDYRERLMAIRRSVEER